MMGDKMSWGTCPEGDKGDTPIGGVSRLSLVPPVETVPGGLTITETLSLHDGEAMHWWDWSREAVADFEQFPRFFSAGFDGAGDRHDCLAGQAEQGYRDPTSIISPIKNARE